MGKRAISAPDLPPPFGPYCNVVSANGFIFVAGCGPIDIHGHVVGDGIEEQTRETLGNLERMLAAAGATLHDLCQVTVYLADFEENFAPYNEVYAALMPDPASATRATIPTNLTRARSAVPKPRFLIELQAIAVEPSRVSPAGE